MGELENWWKSTKKRIDKNPYVIDNTNAGFYALEENAFGKEVRSNTLTPFTGSVRGRVTKDNSTIPQETGSGTPQVTEETYYFIMERDTVLPQDLEFTYLGGVKYRTEKPENVYRNGQVAYIRCSLQDITEGR